MVKNPNWQEADQLAIYKRGRGVELGATVKQLQLEIVLFTVLRPLLHRSSKPYTPRFVLCSVQASFYVLFLTVLSYALIYGATQDDPTKYSGEANGLRLFCEILTIIFLMFYFFEEVNQAER